MSKTAMQELIAYCEQQAGVVASEDYRMGLEDVIGWCQRHYLDKEKEQIKDAWEAGEMFGERVERDGLNHTQVIQVRAEYLKNQNI